MRAKKYLTSKDKTGTLDKGLKSFKRFKAIDDGGYTSRDKFPGTNQKGTSKYKDLNETAASIYGAVMPQPLKMDNDGDLSIDGGEVAEAALLPLMRGPKSYKAFKAAKAPRKAPPKPHKPVSVEAKSKAMARKIQKQADENVKKSGPVNPKNKARLEQDIRLSKPSNPTPPKKVGPPKPAPPQNYKAPSKKKSFMDFKKAAR